MDFKFWEFYRRYGLIFVLNLIPYCSRFRTAKYNSFQNITQFLSNYEFVGANKFSLITALEASHSLKTIKLPLSSRRSCIYGNHFSLSCGGSFLVVELSPPSDSWSDVYPS